MAGFRAASGGNRRVTARFAAAQAGIIRNLVSQVAELVGGDAPAGQSAARQADDLPAGSAVTPPDGDLEGLAAQLGLTDAAAPPDDPALARLLPDAYRDDPEAAAEFRRYTEQGLREAKVAAAQTVLATLPPRGGRIRLTEPESQAWLRALNDVRLALSVRLGVTEEFDDQAAQIGPADARYAYVWVYQWLAYLQETLVEALS
jgi:Domain of unknown function (DUF2017)